MFETNIVDAAIGNDIMRRFGCKGVLFNLDMLGKPCIVNICGSFCRVYEDAMGQDARLSSRIQTWLRAIFCMAENKDSNIIAEAKM